MYLAKINCWHQNNSCRCRIIIYKMMKIKKKRSVSYANAVNCDTSDWHIN